MGCCTLFSSSPVRGQHASYHNRVDIALASTAGVHAHVHIAEHVRNVSVYTWTSATVTTYGFAKLCEDTIASRHEAPTSFICELNLKRCDEATFHKKTYS